jgi:prepilin-type processing-associated H-X9-DG protein
MATRGQNIDLDRWLESIGPCVGLIVTASRDERVLLPLPTGVQLEVPQVSVALVLEVKDDTIFNYVDTMLQPLPNVIRMGFDDMQLRSMPIPVPTPINVKPTIARMGSYLVLASNDTIVKAMNSAEKGRTPGILKDEEFQALAKDMPTTAMGFSFLSRRFGDTVTGAVTEALAVNPEAQGMLGLMGKMEGQASYGVSVKMPDGLVAISRTNFDMGEMLALQGAVVPGAILSGMLLPALAQAREKARRISDMNNLKQIGLSSILYADEHNGQFPNDFGALWPYIGIGKPFVSPFGNTPVPANADEVRAGKCDYLLLAKGKKQTGMQNPASTPLACTKPGLMKRGTNVLYCDGHAEYKPAIDAALQKLIQAAK